MKTKIKADIKAKSIPELIAEADQKSREIIRRRMEVRTGKSKNTNLSRLLDNLAVIKTILRQKTYKETVA